MNVDLRQVELLSQELDDVKDALRQEQLCVAQLHSKTRVSPCP